MILPDFNNEATLLTCWLVRSWVTRLEPIRPWMRTWSTRRFPAVPQANINHCSADRTITDLSTRAIEVNNAVFHRATMESLAEAGSCVTEQWQTRAVGLSRRRNSLRQVSCSVSPTRSCCCVDAATRRVVCCCHFCCPHRLWSVWHQHLTSTLSQLQNNVLRVTRAAQI